MRLPVLTLALASLLPAAARAEALLQLFNTSWREVTTKMPELAEAGYTSLWLPPPCKGSGGLSVGYDLWDRFDLGSKDQRGGVRTRYGTEAELKDLVRVAHRFGIRVYFDNIMNHNAFDTPGFNAAVSLNVYPGFWPEDFHLRKTADGFYRKWDNTRNWNDAWQVQNLGLADLVDIAHESPNANFGLKEGDTIPKLVVVRQPNNPEYYYDTDLPLGTDGTGATLYTFANKEPFDDVGWGGAHNGAGNGRFDWDDANGNGQHDPGEVSEPFQDLGLFPGNPDKATAAFGAGDGRYNMGNPVKEDVNGLLIRAARWQLDRLSADGFRLDAVKHVPDYFFGQQSGANKDASGAGYNGGIQTQFNLTRGFTDWSNHRNSLFDTEAARDDAMLFGEHLGEPPGYGGYIDAGMRLIDNGLRNELNNRLGNPSSGLNGYDQPGYGGFAPGVAVMHAQSHDNDYASRRELQHAFYLTRAGLGLVYSDGNTHADILGASGGAFPRHANTAYLGQFNDPRIPNVLYLNQHLARGYQVGRFSDADFVAYERVDKRENGSMSDADGVTLLFMLNDNYANGLARTFTTSFPATAGGSDAYLYNYSTYNGGFYTYASNLKNVIVPPGGYFAFSWRSPEENTAWKGPGGTPLTILQNNQPVSTVTVTRQDGPQGDPAFNPAGLADTNQTDYRYNITLPRVTDGSALRFIARADGSAENILFKLDGGMDLNGDGNRDNPPATGTDTYAGYEQGTFAQRHYPEKFAAKNTARCIIGSAGAETYFHTVGSAGSIVNGFGTNPQGNSAFSFLYHDPDATVEAWPGPGAAPSAQYAETATEVVIYAKANDNGSGETLRLYYTFDSTDPEGGGGQGLRSTQVAAFTFAYAQTAGNIGEWWRASFPKPAAGTAMRYKVGAFKNLSGGNPVASLFPTGATEVANKKDMATVFEISNFNATTAGFRIHADYGERITGLEEGFHMLRARAFLRRDGRASIYNTFQQSFYYDTKVPDAAIIYPGNDNEVLGGSNYGVVVRADASTTEVWYRITDSAANNDDATTGVKNGNGAWVKASEVTPSNVIRPDLPREFRFNYNNIPSAGTGQIEVIFREISSGTDLNADPAAGHFKRIVRPVNTAGPARSLYIAYPQADGDTVDASYQLKAYFSKNLADGLSSTDALARFTVALDSSQNNDSSDAVALAASSLSLVYNETATSHALAFSLDIPPGTDPAALHEVIVTHREPGGLTTTASRLVRLTPSSSVYLDIVNPAELDSDGKPVVLLFPLKPAGQLTAADRTFSVRVATTATVGAVTLDFTLPAGPGSNLLTPSAANPQIVGSQKFWDFAWTGVTEGSFQLRAQAFLPGNATAAATRLRATTTAFRQLVTANDTDIDDDDDGLADAAEANSRSLPTTADTAWTNGDVHLALISGLTNPLSPDTDGDGLPDALELGWRAALPGTSTTADTDGDGFPNFAGDLDPPFYNTEDNSSLPNYLTGQGAAGRTRRIQGSVTDPNNPDTDGDGLPDGLEDRNHNGWTDGDGEPLAANAANSATRKFPNGKMDPGEVWLETSPAVADSDADGLTDGYGEDKDLNGYITGDTNRDRVWQPGEFWTETDSLNRDTDGDGLPDGWEVSYGLDPLDNGTISFRTGLAGDPRNGASGDPDGDTFTNLSEFVSGTNPVRFDNPGSPPPANSIVIGPRLPATTVGGVVNTHEFDDWTINDLLVLDEVEDDAGATRDLVAFYARDGGAPSAGGDGNFYFRTDFQDLAAYAEDNDLDIWVIVDVGNTAVGETLLPGDVNAKTNMRWDVAVLCDNGTEGKVYVDTNHTLNTTGFGQSLAANGVVTRTQTDANGFGRAWFNSKLDAAEFSISRQALLDAGWNGIPSTLHFQVYTTKDNTGDSPVGSGDRSGRNDLYDTIYDDDVAYTGSTKDTLTSWFGFDGTYDRGRRARVLNVFHGHQDILPGSDTQNLVNTGAGAGLYRLLDAHEAYGSPFTLHVTPTLASALQWAAVDPAKNKAWRDGPTLNTRLAGLRASGLADLTASTFSDHILPYFPASFTADNVALADDVLTNIYGAPSSKVFWAPQRVLSSATISGLPAMTGGRDWTFCDRSTHLVNWFGFNDATYGNNRYRVQRYAGTKIIPLQDDLSDQLFSTADGGASLTMRTLLLNLARDNDPALVCALCQNWQDFTSKTSADSYDQVLAWLSCRPWIHLVTADQLADNQVDLSRPADGTGDTFTRLERGSPTLALTGKVSLQHDTEGSYDNWYFGLSSREEGLEPKVFKLRGTSSGLPLKYGRVGVDGLADSAWQKVSGLASGNPAAWLARAAVHASVSETAAHNQLNGDSSRYSTGDFIYPDTDYNTLSDRTRHNAPQIRTSGLAARVAAWHTAPSSGQAAEDVDLDGEPEYLLFNTRLFAVFERQGGRLTAAFLRSADGSTLVQVVGNQMGYSASETEDELPFALQNGTVSARRTSGFKDLYAVAAARDYVNDLYTVQSVAGGFTFASADGRVSKTVTLDATLPRLAASYSLGAAETGLYIRFGLSPDLRGLLVDGQSRLTALANTGGQVGLTHNGRFATTRAYVLVAGPGTSNVTWNNLARDDSDTTDFDTINLRNQAQTQQVEILGTGPAFSLVLGFGAAPADSDGDGLPDAFETANNFDNATNDAAADPDGDGLSNLAEYLLGSNPRVADGASRLPRQALPLGTDPAGSFRLSFPTLTGRLYRVEQSGDLSTWTPATDWFAGTGTEIQHLDPAVLAKRFYRISVQASPLE